MCALLASTEKIVRITRRGIVYETAYRLDNTPQVSFQNLQETLVDIYCACLKLLADSANLFSQNAATRTVHAILHPKEIESHFSTLAELERNLSNEVQA